LRAIASSCLPPEEPRTTCSAGDEPFTKIWLQHRADMLSLCRRCTRQEADAEEAFSRASLLLYRKLSIHLARLDNLRGWILRLTFNVCMSLHRENRRRAEQSLEEIDAENGADARFLHLSHTRDPETSYLQKEMVQFLRSSIDNLPERLRETVIGHLRLANYREIADHLSINEANARKRMQEAREALSRELAEYRAGAPHPGASRQRAKSRGPPARAQPCAALSETAPVRALRRARSDWSAPE